MVNFRYHLVTITAIFVALAAGIILGVTVGNTATDRIEKQFRGVQAETRTIDATNRALRGDLDTWGRFSESAAAGLLAGRLADVPVLLIGVRGADGKVAKQVREALTNADASVLGTVWLTGKLKLERADDVATLAGIIDLPVLAPSQVRSAAMSRLARQLAAPDRPASAPGTTTTVAGPVNATTTSAVPAGSTTSTTALRASRPTTLAGLAGAGFVDLEDPAGGRLDPQVILPEATRFVVLSAQGVDVADDLAAIPLVTGMVEASAPSLRTVAIEPGKPAKDKDPEVRAAFIGPLRSSGESVDASVSTVDDVEDFRGLAAMVLALADLGVNRVGHYGIGTEADRLAPEAG